MTTHLTSVVFDAGDPLALARWWGETLGWPVAYEDDDEVVLSSPDGGRGIPDLVFVTVPEPKATKNRVHLDLASQSVEDRDRQVEDLLARGARRVDIGQVEDDVDWIVVADPEGNELCVLGPRERYLDQGPLAAIVLDAVDPEALAAFWAEASGWPVAHREEGVVSLHNPSGARPDLDVGEVPEPPTVKARIHLDVAPWPDGDHDGEVARLQAAGARPADIGQGPDVTWVVLADPEGNELCVLTPRD